MAAPSVTSRRSVQWSKGPQKTPRRHKKSKSCNLPQVVRLADHVTEDGGRTYLVESPRKIMLEKTFFGAPNPLESGLNNYYEDVVVIPDEEVQSAQEASEELMNYIIPRIAKLSTSIGLKITGRLYSGSTFDSTKVLNTNDIEIMVIFDKFKTRLEPLEPGYQYIPLRKHKEKKGSPPDAWRFGRSEDQLYLSSQIVAYQFHQLIERALKLHPSARALPFCIEDGRAQILVLQEPYTFSIIPAAYVENEDYYLVTRPYAYDVNPSSDMIWRMSYVQEEKKLLKMISHTDRGSRHRAYLCLKALAKQEHTLEGITSYQLKTVLLHSFDDTVDSTPRWQRNTIESCFMDLLKKLHCFLARGCIPHFFIKEMNLLDNMPQRTLARLKGRVWFLIHNANEIVRLLKKHNQV